MIKVNWIRICSYAYYDEKKNLCVISEYDNLSYPSLPTIESAIYVAAHFSGNYQESIAFTIGLYNDIGIAVGPPNHFNVTFGKPRSDLQIPNHRIILKFRAHAS